MNKHYLYSTWYWLFKQQKRHSVQSEWSDFKNFISDIGERPSEKYRLTKFNSELGYIRGNVGWKVMEKHKEGFVSHSVNWNEKNRGKKYFYKIKSTYGLTKEEYNNLYEKSNGCCYICGKHENEQTTRLAIDHCHTTQKVRGLLCDKCNRGLGYFDDNIENFKSVIKYLQSETL